MEFEDALNEMLVSIAEADDAIDAILLAEANIWSIHFTDGTEVSVEANVPFNKISLISPLGQVGSDQRDKVLTTLLNYALIYNETGGLRMGLGGVTEETAYLIADTSLTDATADILRQMLTQMTKTIPLWSRFIANGVALDAAPLTAEPPATMIRV